jgi:hypothetical protein
LQSRHAVCSSGRRADESWPIWIFAISSAGTVWPFVRIATAHSTSRLYAWLGLFVPTSSAVTRTKLVGIAPCGPGSTWSPAGGKCRAAAAALGFFVIRHDVFLVALE